VLRSDCSKLGQVIPFPVDWARTRAKEGGLLH
jgi:hypothetical protein